MRYNTVFNYRNLRPDKLTVSVANATTLIELTGIKTAAISGERVPCTAKKIPATLYRNEIKKLILTIFIEILVFVF